MESFCEAARNDSGRSNCIRELEYKLEESLCIDTQAEEGSIAHQASIRIVSDGKAHKVVPNHADERAKQILQQDVSLVLVLDGADLKESETHLHGHYLHRCYQDPDCGDQASELCENFFYRLSLVKAFYHGITHAGLLCSAAHIHASRQKSCNVLLGQEIF